MTEKLHAHETAQEPIFFSYSPKTHAVGENVARLLLAKTAGFKGGKDEKASLLVLASASLTGEAACRAGMHPFQSRGAFLVAGPAVTFIEGVHHALTMQCVALGAYPAHLPSSDTFLYRAIDKKIARTEQKTFEEETIARLAPATETLLTRTREGLFRLSHKEKLKKWEIPSVYGLALRAFLCKFSPSQRTAGLFRLAMTAAFSKALSSPEELRLTARKRAHGPHGYARTMSP